MPKNMRSFDESSGGFSAAVFDVPATNEVSEGAVEGAVEDGDGSVKAAVAEAILTTFQTGTLTTE